MTRQCLNCNDGILRYATKNVTYEYKGHVTQIPKLRGWHCPNCREVEFDSDEAERFAECINQFAGEIDQFESAELARIRKKLRLTQVEAARITGGGPNAFSRYETGKTRPLNAVTNLFRLLDRHPELLEELQRS